MNNMEIYLKPWFQTSNISHFKNHKIQMRKLQRKDKQPIQNIVKKTQIKTEGEVTCFRRISSFCFNGSPNRVADSVQIQ